MSDNINSHSPLMLSVYKSFHETVKYGRQRNHILQDWTGLETKISTKASKTENWLGTGFQQPKTSLSKNGINIPSLCALRVTDRAFLTNRQLYHTQYKIMYQVPGKDFTRWKQEF